jgi:glycosyltransferase involved in cell wall biosynthesis
MRSIERIVILTPGFPGDEKDTANLPYLQDLVLSYKKYFPRVEVRVIAFQFPFREGEYNWNAVRVYSAGGKNEKFLQRMITWKRVWKKLLQWHAEKKIDVVHSFWLGECTFIAQRFSRAHSVKHVASIMGRDVQTSNRYFSFFKFGRISVVAISSFLAERFRERSGKAVSAIIPFGLDPEKMRFSQVQKPEYDIIGAGSLIPLKNYSLFIELIAQLKKERPGIRSCIIGKGPEVQMLRDKVNALRLENNVELKGEIAHDKVFEEMCKSKIFLHTSSFEGQSLVMMEALYAGLEVVCFDTGRPYNGKKMNVCHSKEEMLQKLRALLGAPANRNSVSVQTVKQAAEQYFELYSKD